MGQAKLRGNFEERKAEAIENKKEQDRLNEWLRARQERPHKVRTKKTALALIMAAVLSTDLTPLNKRYQ